MATETKATEKTDNVTPAEAEMSAEELRAELLKLQPQTELGRDLIALALRGLAEGVPRMSPTEIQLYLNRDRHA
jgi:hypothetical protein